MMTQSAIAGALLVSLQWVTLAGFVRSAFAGRIAVAVVLGLVHYAATFGMAAWLLDGLRLELATIAGILAGYVAGTVVLAAGVLIRQQRRAQGI